MMQRTCSTCIHDGCCIGLPHCGGSCWAPAFGPCAECDRAVPLDDVEWQSEDGHIFCSEKCLNIWIEDHKEGEDDDV